MMTRTDDAMTSTLEAPGRPELTERRYVYNGDTPSPLLQTPALRGNRPIKRRKRSPFNLVAMILVISILIVFYVWNKITVNQLAIEVGELGNQYQKITSSSDVLRSEIGKKSTLERIGKMAAPLGLVAPKEQPVWIEADLDRIERFTR